jgi:hypothetical protein
MPTTKTRINIPVSDRVNKAIEILAKRDETSVSTKAWELIQTALELEEDAGLLMIAQEREKHSKKSDYLSHEEVWG